MPAALAGGAYHFCGYLVLIVILIVILIKLPVAESSDDPHDMQHVTTQNALTRSPCRHERTRVSLTIRKPRVHNQGKGNGVQG